MMVAASELLLDDADAAPLGEYGHLLPSSRQLDETVLGWLQEDTPGFDVGGYVVGSAPGQAILYAKSTGLLAGSPWVESVFSVLACQVVWTLKEGSILDLSSGGGGGGRIEVARVTGPTRSILQGERVALNILARCSGIATTSRRFLVKARRAGYRGIIAGTRKTTPGFRLVEKYGMVVGGIDPHRYDLSSMVMLKDNHIWSKGSITKAVEAARSVAGFSTKVEVECQDQAQAEEAILAGADIVMLDNLKGVELHSTARRLKDRFGPGADKYSAEVDEKGIRGDSGNGPALQPRHFLIETSGGIDLDTLEDHLSNDLDILSTSAVHQSTHHIDFSLKIQPRTRPAANSLSRALSQTAMQRLF